jgi:PilZ domain-containing protein
MPAEQRRWRRKQIGTDGFLYASDGRQIGPCEVRDVSEGGAMLVISADDELPVELVLSLSRNGQVRRHCRVVWQAAKHAGVRFTATATT